MTNSLKYIFIIALIPFFFTNCKKQELPSELTSDVKSYDFYAVGGSKTIDNGFIVYCNEKFNLYTLNNKIVKIGPSGKVEWQYKFEPKFINDSNYVFVNIMDIVGTIDSYSAFVVKDSVSPLNGDSLKHDYTFRFVQFNLSGQKVLDKSIAVLPIDGDYLGFSGNILSLKNGRWFVGFNFPYRLTGSNTIYVNYYYFELTSTGNLVSPIFKHFTPNSIINKLKETSTDNLILVGENAYVALFSSTFNLISEKKYKIHKSYTNNYTNIIAEANNKFLITGYADIGTASAFQFDYSLTLIDQNIDTIWTKTLDTPKQDYCLSSIATNAGDFALIGITNYAFNTNEDYASSISLIKTNANGNEIYSKKLAEGLSAKGLLISENIDKSFNILGTKLAYGNPSFHHTIFMRTKLE